ncbi:hypothetical protein SAMN06295888_11295 [Desulfonatronum zhilinae]|nr:hypothetical protein SAMN06295888_11295 [Desulfonatronum zhilinae]
MYGTNTDHGKKVVKIAQELLLDEEDRTAINSDLISEKIDMVLGCVRNGVKGWTGSMSWLS